MTKSTSVWSSAKNNGNIEKENCVCTNSETRRVTAIASLLFDPSPHLTRDARALVRSLSTTTDSTREFYHSLGDDPVFAAGKTLRQVAEVAPRASPTPPVADVPPPLWEECPPSVALPALLAPLESVRCSAADTHLLGAGVRVSDARPRVRRSGRRPSSPSRGCCRTRSGGALCGVRHRRNADVRVAAVNGTCARPRIDSGAVAVVSLVRAHN
jgi:hypothetical protein